MIKLSTFMLDPVKARELYAEEISVLESKLKELEDKLKTLKKEKDQMYKTMKEKVRQQGCQIAAMRNSNVS